MHENSRRDPAAGAEPEGKLSGPKPCPQHRYTARDLRAYLSLRDSGDDVPPELTEHLAQCAECWGTWKFLARTNPLLANYRKQRFGLVARQVWKKPAAPVDFDPEERAELLDELTSAIARSAGRPSTGAATGPYRGRVPHEMAAANGPLTADAIILECDEVRSEPDELLRAKEAVRFAEKVKKQVPSEPPDFLLEIADMLMAQSDPIVLDMFVKSRKEGDEGLRETLSRLTTAVAFIASIPFASLLPDKPVLERDVAAKTILAHPARLRQAMDTYKDLVRSQSAAAGIR